MAQEARFEFLDENHVPIVINPSAEASGIENAKDVVKDALLDRASDVHIEPSAAEKAPVTSAYGRVRDADFGR